MTGRAPVSGDLFLDEGRVVAVVPDDPEPEWAGRPEVEIDARELWILPGFVQTHVHLCQSLIRGAAEGRTLYRWLSEIVWPWEAALEPETMEASVEMGVRQLLAGGTTCVLDMGTTHDTETVAHVLARSGLRAFLGPAAMDRGPDPARLLLRTPRQFLDEVESLASRWHRFDDGRLQVALCPRFVPSVSGPLWETLARDRELGRFCVHTHGSETREEVDDVISATGKTPPRYYASLGGPGRRFKIAHGVWMDEDDRRALADMGAAISHCPSSNLKLGSGTADVLRMREAGIAVGLGADGAACNNRLDMWQEMRLAAQIQTLLHGPESVDARAVLEMATRGGAEALGLEEQIGTLEAEKWADLIVLDPRRDPLGSPAPLDGESPEALIVFAGSAAMVRESWVMGRRVHAASEVGTWQREWFPRIESARTRLLERAGSSTGKAK